MITLEGMLASENFNVIYWSIAIGMSVFWGFYGIMDEANKDTEAEVVTKRIGKIINYRKTQTKYIGAIGNPKQGWKKLGPMYSVGAFLSDFAWSFIGWSALYLLLSQYCCAELVVLNIFLGIVAIVGITGYGFKIPEKMKIG